MTFDGATGIVDVPYHAQLNPAVWTLLCWWFAGAQTFNNPLIDCRPASSGALAAGFDLFLNVAAGIGISVCSTNVAQTILTAVVADRTKPHLAAATYDGAQVRLYSDNALVAGPSSCPYTPNPNKVTAIGHLTGGANWVAGVIDEPAILPVVLSLADIQSLFNAGNRALGTSVGAMDQAA